MAAQSPREVEVLARDLERMRYRWAAEIRRGEDMVFLKDNEKLGTVGVASGVGHTHETLPFIGKKSIVVIRHNRGSSEEEGSFDMFISRYQKDT